MKCPLRNVDCKGAYDQDLHEDEDCLKEECAWWDESQECCSMLALSRVSVALGNILGKIADRKSINVQLAK